MFRWSRSSKLYLLVALPFAFAVCAGEPTGPGDLGDGAVGLEAPGPSSSDEGGATGASGGSGDSSGSEASGESGDSSGSGEGGGDNGEEPLEPVGDEATGYARVVFTQSGGLASGLLAEAASRIQASVASGKLAGLSKGQIEFIEFSLTGVQLHRLGAVKNGEEGEGEEATSAEGEATGAEGEEESQETAGEEETGDGNSRPGVSGASWVTVELAEGTTLVISLTDLPPEAVEAEASANGSGLEIAAGELPGGTYKNVRLLGEATITFSEDLTMGDSEYVAGEAYPLEIPSSESSGVKVKTPKFSVDDGGTAAVTIVFDGAASIKKIKLKPGGAKMVPVMRANVEVGTTEAPDSPAP